MRIRYSFTSDLSEVMEKVVFHLEHFKERRSLEKQFAKIISGISKEELNHAVVLKQIGELREDLSKLDLLLIETSDVVSVCQQGLTGNYNVEDVEQKAEQKVEQKVEQETLPTQALQTMQLQNAYKNIQNILWQN